MSGKAKDIDSLLRLQKWIVDERQRELGFLLQRQDEFETLGRELDRQMLREQKVAAEDPILAGTIFAAFAANHRHRREQLQTALHFLLLEIEKARENLAEAYRQSKVYEEVRKARALKEQEEEARQEQIILDEIGQSQFQRWH